MSGFVPADKVAEVVRPLMGDESVPGVARRAGMGEKRLRDLLAGKGARTIQGRTVDRLLCALGRPDVLHVELEDAA